MATVTLYLVFVLKKRLARKLPWNIILYVAITLFGGIFMSGFALFYQPRTILCFTTGLVCVTVSLSFYTLVNEGEFNIISAIAFTSLG